MALLRGLILVVEVEAEMGLVARTGDLEWNFCASSILPKERIHRFQQNGFPARSHLGELGVQSQGSVKIENVAVETVLARHVGPCARNLEMQRREGKHALTKDEYAFEVGSNIRFVGFLRADDLSLAVHA